MSKLPPYRLFRAHAGIAGLILQVRDPETGEAVNPADLECYRARRKLDSAWHGVTIPAGTKLLLTPRTARHLINAGTITRLEEPALIISRKGAERPGGPTVPALKTARKARPMPAPANDR